ncbi:hypothetical protein GALMADRAFT_902357 [Galerina marginata CBS 339.88]|uniref:Uncharacterized protein n=1 Tax=Galerina marginata (strain CBS 339.88) TaxID=685588 RepID=A0A067SGG9_GALM3|nr:hypothetical protein GALMADRAFT_902357 [Galerina marginata CBS 339.88]
MMNSLLRLTILLIRCRRVPKFLCSQLAHFSRCSDNSFLQCEFVDSYPHVWSFKQFNSWSLPRTCLTNGHGCFPIAPDSCRHYICVNMFRKLSFQQALHDPLRGTSLMFPHLGELEVGSLNLNFTRTFSRVLSFPRLPSKMNAYTVTLCPRRRLRN